jgi:hypothetical protein
VKIFSAISVFVLMIGLSVCCLLLSPQKVSAQSFHDFAPTGAVWYYSYEPLCSCDGVVRIVYEGDTAIDATQCKKLQIHRFIYNGVTNSIDTNDISYEYLKVDSYKVYRFAFGQFILLYDFGSQAGDIWEIAGSNTFGGNCDTTGQVRVDSIGKFIVGSDTLKIFYTSPYNGSDWSYSRPVIEKFGSLWFLIPEPSCVVDVDYGGPLRCYSDSSFGSYVFDTTVACDWFFTSSNNISPKETDVIIIPNPLTTSTTITLPSLRKISNVKLFDELGREVSLTSQSSQQENKTQLTIERGNLVSGMYFLSITSNEKKEVMKLMIE